MIKTNIVCPPTIYGESQFQNPHHDLPRRRLNKASIPLTYHTTGNGRGPINQRGRQVYELAKLILTGQYIPIIGPGKARWNHIHVADLSDAYVLLVEAAVSGTRSADAELWGARGYTFTERGEHVWGELSRLVGKKAVELGYVKGELEEKPLGKEKALEQAGFEAISWGLNSRGKAERAGRTLGWKATRGSIEDDVEEILKAEHARLQG